jgi:hypothetical protein
MKLIEEHQRHQTIFNKGFRFNPEDETFFTADAKKFNYPEDDGYKHWKIKPIDPSSYFNERMGEMALKEEDYSIELYDKTNQKYKAKIFLYNKHGDIEILQYSLRRQHYYYDVKTTSAGTVEEYCVQKRLNPEYAIFCEGKYDFWEGINAPFWHPSLVEAFENSTEIQTLTITEGQFKSFMASQNGVPTVGLTSISHFRNKKLNSIHPEILEFIDRCKVKNVVILWDGDCRNISQKHLDNQEELTQRPSQFFGYARSIKKLIQKSYSRKLFFYFATIKTNDISENPKGIDDLFLVKRIRNNDILNDFEKIGTLPGYYIDWINISAESGEKQLRQYFNLSSVIEFYRYHEPQIQKSNFIYYGTTYRVEKGVPVVEVDKNLKKYMRIGPNYFRLITEGTYNNDGEKVRDDEILCAWKPEEIKRDFGKDALNNIVKLDGFCNIPNHINYKQIVDNKWNLYSDIKHEAIPGEFKTIEKFLRHIFQDQYEMGLDYIQLLYSRPFQKLPVLGLVSKIEGTGKSTFLKFLFMIFQNNMTFVTPEDILGQWSSHWVSKLIVASEETFFEKKEALEKIKNISTADKIMRSERFVNSSLIDCFVKFVFCSNHEDDFIKLNNSASRFWIIKVKQIPEEEKDTELEVKMVDEIPHFMHFINNRQIVHPRKDRMWFDTRLTKTEAFHNIVKHSEPGVVKNLRIKIEDYFLRFPADTLTMCVKDFKKVFDIHGDDYFINKMVQEFLSKDHQKSANRYSYYVDNSNDLNLPVLVRDQGRFYTFKREDFVGSTPARGSVASELPF